MTVKGAWPFSNTRGLARTGHLVELRGKKVAVDAFALLYWHSSYAANKYSLVPGILRWLGVLRGNFDINPVAVVRTRAAHSPRRA